MKKLFKQIILFFKDFKRKRELNRGIKIVEAAAEKKIDERLRLRYNITKFINSYAKFDKDNVSKYIPFDAKTKAEIIFQVDLKYGEQMKKLNVKLTNKLKVL